MNQKFLPHVFAVLLLLTAGCDNSPPTPEERIARDFEQAYEEWYRWCHLHGTGSSHVSYTTCKEFRIIVDLGEPTLPLLYEKAVTAQFPDMFLSYAILELKGWEETDFQWQSYNEQAVVICERLKLELDAAGEKASEIDIEPRPE